MSCSARHDDPADRRQVVVTMTATGSGHLERFRELNAAQMRRLLARLGDAELDVVEEATRLLAAAAKRRASHDRPPLRSSPGPGFHASGRPFVESTQRACRQQAERRAPPRQSPCSSPASPPWGSLKQELLPGHPAARFTVVAADPGRAHPTSPTRSRSPSSEAIAGHPAPRAVQSTSANSIALVVAQFSYGTNVKDTKAAIAQNVSTLEAARERHATGQLARHQRLTGHSLPRSSAPVRTARRPPRRSPRPRSCRISRRSTAFASVDLAGGLTSRVIG